MKYLSTTLDHFWARWRKEYLLELRERVIGNYIRVTLTLFQWMMSSLFMMMVQEDSGD